MADVTNGYVAPRLQAGEPESGSDIVVLNHSSTQVRLPFGQCAPRNRNSDDRVDVGDASLSPPN